MIWRYKLADGGTGYGCPVTVRYAGKFRRAVYQYPGDRIVDLPTGVVIARPRSEHTGYPQQIAQQALNSGYMPVPAGQPIINNLPEVMR